MRIRETNYNVKTAITLLRILFNYSRRRVVFIFDIFFAPNELFYI